MDAYKRSRKANQSDLSDDSLLGNNLSFSADPNSPPSPTSSPMVRASSGLPHRLCKSFFHSYLTGVLVGLFTLYALFGDDARLLLFGKEHDEVFYALTVVCIAVFCTDISLSIWLRKEYLWSFYFCLDVISTLSLVPDIGWIWNAIPTASNSDTSLSEIQGAGKASRVGARASKIIRVLRLLKLIRLVKVYRQIRPSPNLTIHGRAHEILVIPEESRIGKKMSELTTKRVIAIVLLLLLALPLLDLSSSTPLKSWDYAVDYMDKFLGDEKSAILADRFISYQKADGREVLLFTTKLYGELVLYQHEKHPDSLRDDEKITVSGDYFTAVIDIRSDTKLAALLNICRTLFICSVFAFGTVYLTKVANDLVIIPIEKMIDKVKRIAENPLAAHIEKMKDVYDMEEKRKRKCCTQKETQDMETLILENAILKISALLALSFGEAGSYIIAENLKQGGQLNLMLAGKRTTAIFGFCDVRNFTDVTEVLQEDVMVFVNEIAEIVHHVVDAHLGAANKNIGDAFLLVWKLEEKKAKNQFYKENMGDLALICFVKILVHLARSRKLQRYRTHLSMLRRLPKYRVRIGCGLHYGWAIEGSIGSEIKIDASYLSPHVNIVAQLEESTKVYGVPILLSNALFEIFSPATRLKCRHLDTVLMRGVKVKLYTFDIEVSLISGSRHKKYSKSDSKHKRMLLLRAMQSEDFHASALFEVSSTLVKLRSAIDDTFQATFAEGVLHYEAGDWRKSEELLTRALDMGPDDQPCRTLLNYMGGFGFQAPKTWTGFRELT